MTLIGAAAAAAAVDEGYQQHYQLRLLPLMDLEKERKRDGEM